MTKGYNKCSAISKKNLIKTNKTWKKLNQKQWWWQNNKKLNDGNGNLTKTSTLAMQIWATSTMFHFCSQQSPQEKWNKKSRKRENKSRRERVLENMRKKLMHKPNCRSLWSNWVFSLYTEILLSYVVGGESSTCVGALK